MDDCEAQEGREAEDEEEGGVEWDHLRRLLLQEVGCLARVTHCQREGTKGQRHEEGREDARARRGKEGRLEGGDDGDDDVGDCKRDA